MNEAVWLIALITLAIIIYEWGTISGFMQLKFKNPSIKSRRGGKPKSDSETLTNDQKPFDHVSYNKARVLTEKASKEQAGRTDKTSRSVKLLSAVLKTQVYGGAKGRRSRAKRPLDNAPTSPSGTAPKNAEAHDKKSARIISPTDMKLLVDATDERWRPLMVTACYTGMRDVELLGLSWDDVDFYRGRVTVGRTYFDGRFHDTEPESLKRTITVPSIVIETLKDYMVQQEKSGIKVSHHLIFRGSTGKGLSPKYMQDKILTPALEKTGMKDIRFDDIRQSYATALMGAGENAKFIQRQLGYPEAKNLFEEHEKPPLDVEAGASGRLSAIFGTPSAPIERAFANPQTNIDG